VRVKRLSREKLEELATWLAERIEQLTRESLGDYVDDVCVKVSAGDEWPYTIEAEVSIKTRFRLRGVERELEKVLDRAFAEFTQRAAEEGLEPSG